MAAGPRPGTGRRLAPLLAAALVVCGRAHAAGAAYQVDTAEVSEVGSCKVETWFSASERRDAIAAANPSCVADVFRPVEIGAQFARSRNDGEYDTTITPKLKSNFVPSAVGKFGIAGAAGFTYDAKAQEMSSLYAYIPATLRLGHNGRINLNGGWLRDRATGNDHATYGAGVDLRTSDNVWTLTGEAFGQAVKPAGPGENQPRYQLGIRWRPVDRFNLDLIYGHNLIGEGQNWITLAAIIRFKRE